MTPRRRKKTVAEQILADDSATLLDIVDNVLSKGVVLTGDITIGLAHVDLVYVRISLLLCAADQVMPGENPDPVERLQDRHAMRVRVREARRRRRG
jgi:gas vesicle structural protein